MTNLKKAELDKYVIKKRKNNTCTQQTPRLKNVQAVNDKIVKNTRNSV